mmetsp:Transcript_68117/g.160228  ORF Transcript_68117/g.160228 Transcript_68117/m.160228 type:complete len:137 (+) Transcript_68117:356-766(+)
MLSRRVETTSPRHGRLHDPLQVFEPMEGTERWRVRITTWERSAGLTGACGTGTCAAVAAALALDVVKPTQWPVTFCTVMAGGEMNVVLPTPDGRYELHGPALVSFTGELDPSVWASDSGHGSSGESEQPPSPEHTS